MSYQLVIPMTGKGNRFKAAGYKDLKPFISVAGKPIIQHILEMYPNRSKTLFIVNTSDPESERHKSILRDISPGCEIAEIEDHKLGPSFAIHRAADFISTSLPVIVNYADFAGVWSEMDFLKLMLVNDACILTYTGFHPHMLRNSKYAYVKKYGDLVTAIQEKQSYTNEPMQEEASAGAYGFKNGKILLNAIEKQLRDKLDLNGEYYTSLTFVPIINDSMKVATLLMHKFYQWGTPEDLEDWKSWYTFLNILEASPGLNCEDLKCNSVILAGGKGKRLRGATSVPKVLYQVQGKQLWHYSWVKGSKSKNTLVIREEYKDEVLQIKDRHTTLLALKGDTKGQAETALIGLEQCDVDASAINFLSCDNVVLDENVFSQVSDSHEDVLYVWVSNNYQNARNQPEQFSWVSISDDGRIDGFYPKQNPPLAESAVIIGNFTFSSFSLASRAISYCMKEVNWINNEAYLDKAIEFALSNRVKVQPVFLNNFRAIGTSQEIQTFEYWLECKSKRLLSWT